MTISLVTTSGTVRTRLSQNRRRNISGSWPAWASCPAWSWPPWPPWPCAWSGAERATLSSRCAGAGCMAGPPPNTLGGYLALHNGGTQMSAFTPAETDYLQGQSMGRLATVGRDGRPHIVPLTYTFNPDEDTI